MLLLVGDLKAFLCARQPTGFKFGSLVWGLGADLEKGDAHAKFEI